MSPPPAHPPAPSPVPSPVFSACGAAVPSTHASLPAMPEALAGRLQEIPPLLATLISEVSGGGEGASAELLRRGICGPAGLDVCSYKEDL